MKRFLRGAIAVFVLTVLNVLSLGIHAAAIQPTGMGHSTHGSHQASSSNCFTICTIATPYKEEVTKDNAEDEDDKALPPFYVQFEPSPFVALKMQHIQETKTAIDREPPPDDAPTYISLAVFRA